MLVEYLILYVSLPKNYYEIYVDAILRLFRFVKDIIETNWDNE